MTTENLIINGVDHAKFDLEWVKKGGVVYRLDGTKAMLWTYFQGRFAVLALYSRSGWKKTSPQSCIANIFSLLSVKASDRMATPAECEAAGIEYIEYDGWRPIESAPKNGTIILSCDEKWDFSNDDDITLPQIVFWDQEGFVIDHTYSDEDQQYFNPTYWMHLPLLQKDES